MKKWLEAFKGILVELSELALIVVFFAAVLFVGFLLPDAWVEQIPFEVVEIMAVVAILVVLYAISGIVILIGKTKGKNKDKSGEDNNEIS